MKIANIFSLMVFFHMAGCTSANTEGHENSFIFFDANKQSMLIKELKKENIPFRLSESGEVWYPVGKEKSVMQIKMQILHETYVPSYHFVSDEATDEFIVRLRRAGIPYGIEIRGGERWITWGKADDAKATQIKNEVINLIYGS